MGKPERAYGCREYAWAGRSDRTHDFSSIARLITLTRERAIDYYRKMNLLRNSALLLAATVGACLLGAVGCDHGDGIGERVVPTYTQIADGEVRPTTSSACLTDSPLCSACPAGEVELDGECVGQGTLRFSLQWEDAGDIDLNVRTPSGEVIFYGDRAAQGGMLDKDDAYGNGPENIFWAGDFPPGTYDVCLGSFIRGALAGTRATVTVSQAGHEPIVRHFIAGDEDRVGSVPKCDPTSTSYAFSFTPAATPVCTVPSECTLPDGGVLDAGTDDAGPSDAGLDGGIADAGTDSGVEDAGADAGVVDAGVDAGFDAGADAGVVDAGVDAGFDAGVDAGILDAGVDTGPVDAGTPACVLADTCALSFTASSTTDVYGGGGGTPYMDDCPAGQVLVGYYAMVGSSFERFLGVCGTTTLVPGSSAYTITVGAGDTLTEHGSGINTTYESTCPTDQMVVGFEGRYGTLVDRLALRCAPLLVSYTASGVTVTPGSVTTITAVGGFGGTEFPTTDCPAGDVATGTEVHAGGAVDAFGLRCSTPAVN